MTSDREIPYTLSHKTLALYAVAPSRDIIRRGLVRKPGLVGYVGL